MVGRNADYCNSDASPLVLVHTLHKSPSVYLQNFALLPHDYLFFETFTLILLVSLLLLSLGCFLHSVPLSLVA